MKTKSLFVALLMISAVAFAGSNEPVRTGMAVVPVKGSEVYKVIYKGETHGKVKLSVLSSDGKVILAQTFNSDGFIRPLNFAGLQPGEYTITITDAAGIKSEKVVYAAKKKGSNVHISKLKNEDGKYLLSVANAESGPIQVKIFDAKNNVVFTETKLVNGDFAQVYKIEASGSYTFEVSDIKGNVKTAQF
jgi:WD40 repeat protein